MKISKNKYILYSSIFAIYTEAFYFHLIIDWKLMYLILLVNYLLIFDKKSFRFNKYFVFILLFLFFHGLITYTIIKIPPNYLISQLIGTLFIGSYYYNFVRKFDKQEILSIYTKISIYVAVLGFVLYIINYDGIYRLKSLFTEPAHYVVVILPACYYFLKEKKYFPFTIIFASILFSDSSVGYIGCALIFLIPNITKKRVYYLLVAIPIVALTAIFTYNSSENFKIRVDDTYDSLSAIGNGNFDSQTNVSSYALMCNLFVAKQNILEHPFGSGFGSHYYMHVHKYIKDVRVPEYIKTLKLKHLNAPDAASLFIRFFSDLGIFGIVLILYLTSLLIKSFSYTDMPLEQGIVIYIILKLLRDGHYFPPEFYFFIWIIYFSLKNKFKKQTSNEENLSNN